MYYINAKCSKLFFLALLLAFSITIPVPLQRAEAKSLLTVRGKNEAKYNQFLDVSQGHWAVDWINELYSEGITSGCNPTPLHYCPEEYVTRAQMAVFMLRAIHGTAYSPSTVPGIFTDVPPTYWASSWINQLYTEGITNGCNQIPIQYCPEEYVTRAQMAVFLLRVVHGATYSPITSNNSFSDVATNYWARAWINELYNEGITSGCIQSPLQYCPDQYVTRAQMAVFILKAIHGAGYQPPAIDISVPNIGGCPIFPANNIWNTPIDTLPVHAHSAQWINTIGSEAHFHMDFGSGTWNGNTIGIPFNVVSGMTVQHYYPSFLYSSQSESGPYPIPLNPAIEDGSDNHVLVVDTDDCILYEIYDASYSGGQWSGGSGAIWDLNSNTLRPIGWTSADAAGLPILPGLVKYEEVEAGFIGHALRFTVNQTSSYIWPARHLTDGSPEVLTNIPPMGARFRLKSSYNISSFSPELQVILQAMKTYGIIIADNGSNWFISGVPDERWDNTMLHDLDVLQGSDFEAVDSTNLIININSGQSQ